MSLITIDSEKVAQARNHGTAVVQWAESLVIASETDFKEAQAALITVRDGKKKVGAWIKGILDPIKEAVKNAKENLDPLLEPYSLADELATKKIQSYIDAERAKAQAAAEAEKAKREAEAARNKARMNSLLELGFRWVLAEDSFVFNDGLKVRSIEVSKDSDSLWASKMEGYISQVNHAKATAPKKEVAEAPVEVEPLPELTVVAPVAVPDFSMKTDQGTAYTRKQWTFDEEVVDLASVPREFLKLDEVKVREAIASGIREIPGLKIYEKETIITRSK